MKKIFAILIIVMLLALLITIPVMAASTLQEVAPTVEVTPILLGSVAGTVLSLLFSYVPGLNVKFAGLSPDSKRLVMLGVLLLTSLTLYGLRCGGIIDTGFACDRNGVIQLITIFFMALIGNQSVYAIVPVPTSVKVASENAKYQALRDATIGAP